MERRKLFVMGLAVLISQRSIAQDWNRIPGGNIINATEWLGADVGSTIPLRIETRVNQPIDWYTSALGRARLMPTGTATINTFTNVAQNGFFLLSGTADYLTNANNRAPFTRLHLVDPQVSGTNQTVYAQEFGYRTWQRNGITFTGNRDHAYVGQRYWGNDQTDFVVQWADNAAASPWGTDRLKFVFTSAFNAGATRGATTDNGLEAMRLFPVDLLQVNVGIGDFSQPGLAQPDPTERLHLLDGRLRIEQLPDDPDTDDAFRVMVVDATTDPLERGVVKWKDLSSVVDCDWVVQTPDPHVSTAYAGSACDTQEKHGVGIGNQIPKSKLDVYHTEDILLDPIAIRGDARFQYENGETVIGVQGQASTPVTATTIPVMHSIGVEGIAFNGKESIGVSGFASCAGAEEGSAGRIVGVSGVATADNNADVCIGVYGKASGATGGNDLAAFFEGWGLIAAPFWIYSDQGLKQNIESLEPALASEKIMALNPRTYTFNPELAGSLGLPTGVQRGFLSQEVEEILPDLVKNFTRPAVFDSTGTEVEPAMDIKAMNYEGIIPLLVAAFQEDHQRNAALQTQMHEELAFMRATVDEQRSRLDLLEERIAACCSNPDAGRSVQQGQVELENLFEADPKLRIQPNPFAERTTVYYTLERTGRAQLLANSADGKELRVLHESQLEAGQYQYEWDTTELAAGLYYVTLLLDGKPVVKKAVKVAR